MDKKILYSQSWEDPVILKGALKISKKDVILSISSSGDNSLFLLSLNPKEVVSLDINPLQNYLLELKAKGIELLEYSDFLKFVGVLNSYNRIETYNSLRLNLSSECRNYWDKNLNRILLGLVHCGKFERYLSLFRRFVLPISQPKKRINTFLNLNDLEEQKKFYEQRWNNPLWKLTFRIFFSENIMRWLGRDPELFKHNLKTKISEHYLLKAQTGFTKTPIKKNYFLEYVLTGKYRLFNLPEYLREENYDKIKKNIPRLRIITSDLKDYLIKARGNHFTKFNMSDVFEVFSQEEYEEILKEIIRVSKRSGKICYWNNLVERKHHFDIDKNLIKSDPISKELSQIDRVFFYSQFIVENIRK